jgi:hypothetical protein
MLLRVSSELGGEKVDLQSVIKGSKVQSGVPFQDELLAFAEVALGDDDEAITGAREAVRAKMGDEAVVDAAAVIANFQRMVRIADGAGIPLDTPVAVATSTIRSELGLNSYSSFDNTPELTFAQRILGRLLNPFLATVLKQATKRMISTDKAS